MHSQINLLSTFSMVSVKVFMSLPRSFLWNIKENGNTVPQMRYFIMNKVSAFLTMVCNWAWLSQATIERSGSFQTSRIMQQKPHWHKCLLHSEDQYLNLQVSVSDEKWSFWDTQLSYCAVLLQNLPEGKFRASLFLQQDFNHDQSNLESSSTKRISNHLKQRCTAIVFKDLG